MAKEIPYDQAQPILSTATLKIRKQLKITNRIRLFSFG
jgi:hypothetical protein